MDRLIWYLLQEQASIKVHIDQPNKKELKAARLMSIAKY